jgi:hypothetical protein
VARCHWGDALSAALHAAYRPALLSGANVELGGRMLKSGASLKLIQTSLPPEPLPPFGGTRLRCGAACSRPPGEALDVAR